MAKVSIQITVLHEVEVEVSEEELARIRGDENALADFVSQYEDQAWDSPREWVGTTVLDADNQELGSW